MDTFEEEKKYLNYTLDNIETIIENTEDTIERFEQRGRSVSYEDRQRGEHLAINNQLQFYGRQLISLKKSRNKPYFGRFDFKTNKKEQKLYIGRTGISNDGKIIVVDWRAPISSLYYDSELGPVSYDTPSGKIDGSLTLKRQINIENGQLIDVQDTSLVTDDELLKPYLSGNADNKMKTIIASIQKEQNEIIRKEIKQNFIVQGVAGSGKTSVALHRIAFLIYNLNNETEVQNFLVLGPNNYFLDYVSSILPDLDTTPIKEQTLLDFLNDYTGSSLKLASNSSENEIGRLKTSTEYKHMIDEFYNKYLLNYLVTEPFMINESVIFTKEEILEAILDSSGKGYTKVNFEKGQAKLISKYNREKNDIYERENEKYRAIYTKLDSDDPNRRKAADESYFLYEQIDKNGEKLLKKYLKKINKPILDLYKQFIADFLSFSTTLTTKEALTLQKETLSNIKKKKISFEDIPALLHLYHLYTGKNSNYKFITIDEAQDFGLFHFDALNEICPNAFFSIYGDLAQSVYSYRSVDNWNDVANNIIANCEILNLNKSYRTTMEITETANNILEKMNMSLAEPVVRSGPTVSFCDTSDSDFDMLKIIDSLKNKGYKTIAIICKTEKEAISVNKELNELNVNSKYISPSDMHYDGGICVTTCQSVKGLEFDAVVINDASDYQYDIESEVDMHLLYVASTRGLHEEVVLYKNNLTPLFQSQYKKKGVK